MRQPLALAARYRALSWPAQLAAVVAFAAAGQAVGIAFGAVVLARHNLGEAVPEILAHALPGVARTLAAVAAAFAVGVAVERIAGAFLGWRLSPGPSLAAAFLAAAV